MQIETCERTQLPHMHNHEESLIENQNECMHAARSLFSLDKVTASSWPGQIDFGDAKTLYSRGHTDQTMLAKAIVQESMHSKDVRGNDVARHAHELGEKHPAMWKNEGPHGEIRKCNLFADKVFRDLGVSLPWEKGHTPTVHNMKSMLAHSPDWNAIFHTGQNFQSYKPQAGDLAIWDKTISMPYHRQNGTVVMQRSHVEHCGVIGAGGEIVYAGSARGYSESDFKAMSHSEAFGAPSFIFRSSHVQ